MQYSESSTSTKAVQNMKVDILSEAAGFLGYMLLWATSQVILDQWPKLYLGFYVEPEIQILKVIYFIAFYLQNMNASKTILTNNCIEGYIIWPQGSYCL